MSKIDGYSVYQNQYYDKTQNRKSADKTGTDKTSDAKKADKTSKTDQVQLSDRAKELLKELQAKYGDMDFFVGNYSSDAEAQAYLSRGTKAYSVLMDPETLEAMAADEDTKNQYLDQIDSARTNLSDMKTKLEETGQEVTRVGISFDKDGKVSYFAELEKISEKNREHIEKSIEKRREEKAEKEKKANGEHDAVSPDKVKKTMVYADTVDELLKKIKEVDWNKVGEEELKKSGGLFDLSV